MAIRSGHADQQEYNLAENHDVCASSYAPGWARRSKNGTNRGNNYLNSFRADIRLMFMEGEANQGEKLQPSWMLNRLESKFPNRLCMPSENIIRQEISRLIQLKRAGKPLDSLPGKRGRKGMDEQYVTWLTELLNTEPTLTGKPAVARFREHFPSTEGVPEDSQVLSKVAQLRNKLGLKIVASSSSSSLDQNSQPRKRAKFNSQQTHTEYIRKDCTRAEVVGKFHSRFGNAIASDDQIRSKFSSTKQLMKNDK